MTSEARIERLGDPGLRLAGFQLWVHGYQFPDKDDCRDANLLNVSAHCGEVSASVWTEGLLLDSVSVLTFRNRLAELHRTLRGGAFLWSVPGMRVLSVQVEATDNIGHILVQVDIGYQFRFEVDQTYLPPVIEQCEKLLGTFPVRDTTQLVSAVPERLSPALPSFSDLAVEALAWWHGGRILPWVSGVEAVRALERMGFQNVRQRGSHVVMKRGAEGCVVPLHRELKTGTLAGLLRQASAWPEEFFDML